MASCRRSARCPRRNTRSIEPNRGGAPSWPATAPSPPERSSFRQRREEVAADQGAGQVEQSLEEGGPPLVADAEAAAAEEPGQAPLHHPTVPAQPLGGVDPTSGEARRDSPGTEGSPQGRGIVGLVAVQLPWALARPPRLPSGSDNRRDGINQREQLRGVVGVGRRQTDSERDAVAIGDEVVLGAEFAPVRWVRPGRFAPLFARTLRLSRLARLQSMAASSPSQFSSVSCSRCQTPASCQSRSRRQHVVPLPQPSSFGTSRHGHPDRRAKTIPPNTARSGTRGRPPFGFGGSCGNNGSMASQRSSGTSDAVFMGRHHAIPLRFCNTL